VRENGETLVIGLSELKEEMSDSYFEAFFRSCGIGDKISIITARRSEVLLISFYRFDESGLFQINNEEQLKPFWETIAQLALMHFADNEGPDLQSPLNSLSKREKDICQAVLDGLTSDAIAWRLDISLNTVKTYRKRAYAKLGINSKTALFTLCKTS
jgi:DNA-binding CsgD family transcriptional regulator